MVAKPKEKYHLEVLGIDVNIILKSGHRVERYGMDSASSVYGSMWTLCKAILYISVP
jgi:hypothetical protein